MLVNGEKMYAYPFEGYWKDVGTLSSLWEANMDLLGENPNFDVDDDKWRLRSRTSAEPPQYVGENAEVNYSIIDENVVVGNNAKIGESLNGELKISVLGRDITVADGKQVKAGDIIDENV
jgi:glucose-1-phosphate adenylyltransferase